MAMGMVRAMTLAIRHSDALLDDRQRLAELDGLAVFDQDFQERAVARRRNRVHRLHRFDDQQRLA